MMHFINLKRISIVLVLLLASGVQSFCIEDKDKIPKEVKDYVFNYLTNKMQLEAPSFSKKEKEECIIYDKRYVKNTKKIFIISVCSSHTNYYVLILNGVKYEMLDLLQPKDFSKIINILELDKGITKSKMSEIMKKIIQVSQSNYNNYNNYQKPTI
jgi:hypothetical protein